MVPWWTSANIRGFWQNSGWDLRKLKTSKKIWIFSFLKLKSSFPTVLTLYSSCLKHIPWKEIISFQHSCGFEKIFPTAHTYPKTKLKCLWIHCFKDSHWHNWSCYSPGPCCRWFNWLAILYIESIFKNLALPETTMHVETWPYGPN